MVRIPPKLKNDPIVEALFEVRFTSDDIPEVTIGKLASCPNWTDFSNQRLPLADVPATIREHDPNLAYQPVLQLQRPDGMRVIKIGPRVLSYHTLGPYPGWEVFEPELSASARHVFSELKNAIATRFGFRYVNLLTKDHFIVGISNLNLEVSLAGSPLTASFNLNYQRVLRPTHNSMVRVASVEFVQNPSPNLSALVDIDIFTPATFSSTVADEARTWIDAAHNLLKEEFFTLLPDDVIDKLEDK
jgi:uncharacterized protein (TIGR04255 family)